MSPGKHQLAGEPKRLIGVSMDITDRKHSEEAFRVSEARLAAGTDLAGLGYYEVEYGQRNCFIDDRFRDICGVPPGLQGLQSLEFWMEHVHPDDRQFLLDERQKLHDGRLDRISAEYRYLHPAHGQKWIHHLARIAARSTTGQGVHTFGVVRDITQQKRAELEAQELRNNLAHLARVNTLGALSGSLAHESNQPLGIILSNAQAAQELLLQEPPDLAEVQAILSDIVAADRRAGEVIERLRAMLKHGQVSLQPVVLNQVIEEVLHLTRADLIGRGITVVRQLAPDLPPIAGDRVQLQQLVLNLILNAAEAMTANAPGARRLHLQTMLHQGRVRASVRGMRAAGCRRTWSASSSRSTRPSPRVWAWAWPSAGPLWPLTPAGFGPNLTPSAAPFSNSNCRCRKGQVARAKWQVTDQSNRVPNFTRHQPLATSHRPLLMGGNLEQFGAYQKALELFDRVVDDVNQFLSDRKLERLVSQQLASADSVCSNIEEGYGRESTVEYRRFLIIARGSLRETQGRYSRLQHWIPSDIVSQRIALADEVNRILSATIAKLARP